MDPSTPRSGATLPELTVALAIAGLALGLAAPMARAVVDRIAVVAAREESMALLHRARALALDGGGATLHVVQGQELLVLLDGTGRERERLCFEGSGVDLTTSGSADEAVLSWNALGWGRVSSRTLEFRRGAMRTRLVISSRGRGTRR